MPKPYFEPESSDIWPTDAGPGDCEPPTECCDDTKSFEHCSRFDVPKPYFGKVVFVEKGCLPTDEPWLYVPGPGEAPWKRAA